MHGSGATSVALWLSGPIIWAAHFLLAYVFEPVLCARAGGEAAHASLVVVATVGAISAIVILACLGRRRAFLPDDGFLRFTGVVLSSLAAIAVLWTAMPSLILTACRHPV